MTRYRKNSFIVDFSVLPKRPTIEQVSEFLFKQLELDMSKVKNLQPSISKSQVIIEMERAELVEQIVADHDQQHRLQLDDTTVALIPIRLVGDAVEVRVHDLPPYMPNEMICKLLSSYGEVMSITEEKWKKHFPGVPNGTRIVKMKINKQIPSYLPIDGEVAYIKYTNQLRTCKHCSRPLHVGRTCTEVRKELASINNRLTMAQVVEGSQDPSVLPQLPIPLPQPTGSSSRTSESPSIRSPVRSPEKSPVRSPNPLPTRQSSPMASGSGANVNILEEMVISPDEDNFYGFPDEKEKSNSKRPLSPKTSEGRSSRSKSKHKK